MHLLKKGELIKLKKITDEEEKISEALKKISNIIKYPLLDIGSWSGKISTEAFKDKQVIHIDTLDFNEAQFELPPTHQRLIWDFFEFENNLYGVKTLLFCHSLQYLDDNGIEKVIKKIEEINPEYVILVINNNDGILWKTLEFFKKNMWEENGEKHFVDFPWKNFSLDKRYKITAHFHGKNLHEISQTICKLLLDITISEEQENKIVTFLEKEGIRDEFSINQEISFYHNINK